MYITLRLNRIKGEAATAGLRVRIKSTCNWAGRPLFDTQCVAEQLVSVSGISCPGV